jgi:predicted PurR-regulated permease PerM
LTDSPAPELRARTDLAWAISVGGIAAIGFATLLLFSWYYAATLFLIFGGMLLGVALNTMTTLLARVVRLPHGLRLTIVCVMLAGPLSGAVFLGGATIAQQATVLSNTIKSQLVSVSVPRKERHRCQLSRYREFQRRATGFLEPTSARGDTDS